jgi:hypothetical protein
MVQPDRPQIWCSQTGHRYGTARQATDMVQPDRPQIWYSQTGHRYGTARQATDMVQPDRPQMAVKYGACAFACWILKTTDTHSEYVIIIAFPQ